MILNTAKVGDRFLIIEPQPFTKMSIPYWEIEVMKITNNFITIKYKTDYTETIDKRKHDVFKSCTIEPWSKELVLKLEELYRNAQFSSQIKK